MNKSIKASIAAFVASVALVIACTTPALAYEQVEDTVSYGHGYNNAE